MSRRPLAFALAFTILLGGCALALWNVQWVHGAEYARKARSALVRQETVPAARGRLLDRKGRVLAEDRAVWEAVTENAPGETRARLAVLCAEEGVWWDGVSPLAPLPPGLLARIRGEGLEGVALRPSVKRWSSGSLAPQVLGSVGPMDPARWAEEKEKGLSMDALVGRDGAEAAFEDLLRGTPGLRRTETDRAGRVTGTGYAVLPRPGEDVTLTLDRDIQQTARRALSAYLTAHPEAGGGAAVVLDVADGGVLAMVSLPDYDPAFCSRDYPALSADPARPLLNRAIQGLYPPGSVYKLVTAAAALEEGVVTPETEILDTGRYTYYASPQPQCWLYRETGRTHGPETVDRAIADSCNVFFYDAGRRVGARTLAAYARRLGLGQTTGIELAGEESGVVAGPDYSASAGLPWYPGSVLSAAIGQENNRFTPLQLAALTAALAGEGTRPRVRLRLDAPPGSLGRTGLAPETLEAIRKGMGEAARQGELGRAFSSLPVEVGAKTGSAQVAGSETSNAVLVAFAPYDRPRVALALVAEGGGGGAALGETAAEILRAWSRS